MTELNLLSCSSKSKNKNKKELRLWVVGLFACLDLKI